MSSYKLYIAVSTYIRQKTLFPRCNLAYSDFLGQTSVARKVIAEDYNLIDLQAMDDDSIDYGKQ